MNTRLQHAAQLVQACNGPVQHGRVQGRIQQYECAFDWRPESVALARRFTRDVLAELPDETVGDAQTCVSELAGNAVRYTHSGQPGGSYRVRVERTDAYALVEVTDQGNDHGQAPEIQLGGTESGRGLWIVAQLGDLTTIATPDGHRVSARINLPNAHPADGSG
ncbi:ATP-binding protein [Actinomadura rudentiformis]|uniref:ATP-binding protein n=1 Tax=Actinomadura rudentiformis TaxID=359158 RepID=A0A6H9Z685_9ACTN|nr:ATP-binding protein [Actinomadura rudentiformis]KAB2351609.1 ATP-binding protein [Actinomadura rudentiformis]